jgi:hypothetical protein
VGVLKCDLRNAFNSAPRAPILDAIAEHFPILLAYAICVLCCACFLLYGLFVLLSTLGVQQGDPLGPILFAVGLTAACNDLEAGVVDFAAWFLDDGTAGGTLPNLVRFLGQMRAISAWTVNIEKCELISDLSAEDAVALGFPPEMQFRSKSDWDLLGCPCGSPEAVEAGLRKVFQRTGVKLEAITHITAHIAFTLLRVCCAFGPAVFFARNAGPSPAFAAHDAAVRACFSQIVDNVDDAAWAQAQLPLKRSGLGLRSAAQFASVAFIASRAAVAPLAASIIPSVNVLTRARTVLTECPILETSSAAGDIAAAVLQEPTKFVKVQHTLTNEIERIADEAVLTGGDSTRARLQSTRAPFANAYLVPTHNPDRPTKWLSTAEFRIVIRSRLGLRIMEEAGPCTLCAGRFSGDIFGHHATSCMCSMRTQCHHDLMRETNLFASAALTQPSEECCPFPCAGGSLRVDTLYRANVGPRPVATDLAITGALANSNFKHAASKPAGAATHYEAVKIAKYEPSANQSGIDFIPLVVDSFGAWGERSLPLLLRIARAWGRRTDTPPTVARNIMLTALSLRLQRSMAGLLLAASLVKEPRERGAGG